MAAAPTVVHILHATPFAAPFLEFLDEQGIHRDGHRYFCIDPAGRHGVERRPGLEFASDYRNGLVMRLALLRQLYAARKIFLHGLWGAWLVRLLASQPWLLKKCYWVIWGADLYTAKLGERGPLWYLHELPRRVVIRRMGHLVTYVKGDAELAREWYGARGQYHDCLLYPSNVFTGSAAAATRESSTHIQIGNSADPGNEHREILSMLRQYRDRDIRIHAPLSYGDAEYAEEIAAAGREEFGERFSALTDFLPLERYREFLGRIDIAIFNHRRQQAMGNIINLSGLGKKVYLRRDTTSWAVLEAAGVKVYDIGEFDLEPIDTQTAASNAAAVRAAFSADRLARQWQDLLS